MGDIVAMIIIGLSVFGPMLAKMQQKAKAAAAAAKSPPGEPSTGVQVPRRAGQASVGPSSAGQASARQVAARATSSSEASLVRTIRRKPRRAPAATAVARAKTEASTGRAGASIGKEPMTPEESIAAMHAARAVKGPAVAAPGWGEAARRRVWTRLQEAVVFREMLGKPKALQDEG